MKQTAVEWLIKEIEEKHNFRFGNFYWAEIQQAKEMFEKQVKDAYDQGSEAGYELAKNDDLTEGYKTKEAEQYYKETFKSE